MRLLRPTARHTAAIALGLTLLLDPGLLAAQIAAPVLKWAYGGCDPGSCQTGWYSSPAAADLDGQPGLEVIHGSRDLVALDGSTGALRWRATSSQRIWPAIAVAQLRAGDGLRVVVGRNGNQFNVYRADGSLEYTRSPFPGGEVRSLALADLDGDGDLEIVVGRAASGSTEQMSVYEHDGSLRPGWPARRIGEPGFGSGMYNQNLAIADLDGDGSAEIYGPTDTHYITVLAANGDQRRASTVYGLSNGQPKTWAQVGVHVDHAADLAGFANCGVQHRPNFANVAPAIADLDGDGTLELVVPGDVYDCAVGDPAGDLYYLPWILRADRTRWAGSGHDWQVLPSPGGSAGPTIQGQFATIEDAVVNAVVADLDGDGQREILFPSYDGKLHAWWLDRTQKHNWPFVVPGSGFRFAAEPVVVDLDADGRAEVIFTTWPQKGGNAVGKLYVLDYRGSVLHSLDLPAPRGGNWNGGLAAPTLAQLDADPDLELVINTSFSGAVAYDLPGSAQARVLWGTGRGNLLRNGVAPAPPPLLPPALFRDGFE